MVSGDKSNRTQGEQSNQWVLHDYRFQLLGKRLFVSCLNFILQKTKKTKKTKKMNFNFTGKNFGFNSIHEAVFLQQVVTSESINTKQLQQLLDQSAAYNKEEPERHFLFDLTQDFFVEDMSNPEKAVGTPQDQKQLQMTGKTLQAFKPILGYWRISRRVAITTTAKFLFPQALANGPFFYQVCHTRV